MKPRNFTFSCPLTVNVDVEPSCIVRSLAVKDTGVITPPVANEQIATTSAGNWTVIGRLSFRLWDISPAVFETDGGITRTSVAGELGRLSTGPERNRSPEVVVSRINIVQVVDGGTAVEGKTS